jgi:uncharacterized protein YegP (UPF0339 family)
MAAKFTVYKDKANKFRFNLKAANGEIIASGESYPDKKAALKGIALLRKLHLPQRFKYSIITAVQEPVLKNV